MLEKGPYTSNYVGILTVAFGGHNFLFEYQIEEPLVALETYSIIIFLIKHLF